MRIARARTEADVYIRTCTYKHFFLSFRQYIFQMDHTLREQSSKKGIRLHLDTPIAITITDNGYVYFLQRRVSGVCRREYATMAGMYLCVQGHVHHIESAKKHILVRIRTLLKSKVAAIWRKIKDRWWPHSSLRNAEEPTQLLNYTEVIKNCPFWQPILCGSLIRQTVWSQFSHICYCLPLEETGPMRIRSLQPAKKKPWCKGTTYARRTASSTP